MKVELSIALIGGAYLLGSLPTAYLAGRWLKGRDLRRYGSGTVSGSMVFEHVARWAVVPVGILDVAKAAVPTWLGLQWNLGTPVAVGAGLAAIAGHTWPVFLGFTGGRGVSGILGVLLVVFPWGALWLLGFLAAGWLLGDSTIWTVGGVATVPALANWIEGPEVVTPLTGGMLLLLLAKRLEANRRPLPGPGPERRRVILRRLLYDRDIASHEEWIRRTPD